MADVTMTDTQQVVMTLKTGLDRRGNPTTLPAGSVAWSTDSPALLTLTPSADGMSCTVASAGPLGTGVLTAKVSDASGAALASGSVNFTITSGAPVSIEIDAGTPVEQP